MQVRLEDGRYVTRYTGPTDFDLGPRQKKALRSGEGAHKEVLEISAALRAQGLKATATDDFGENREAVAYVAPVVHVISTWRGITPKLAAQNTFVHSFRAPGGDGAIQSVSGKSPDEVIRKIKDLAGWNEDTKTVNKYEGHPAFTAYVNSLPPEPGTPAAPLLNQQAPTRPDTSGRVLRPGSATYTLPERRIESAPVVREDFVAWEKTATAAQYKERCKTDPAFLAWTNQVAR